MNRIWVLDIGWGKHDLTLGAVELLRSGKRIVLKTSRCECAQWLEEEGIPFKSLDALYEQADDFDMLNEAIIHAVTEMARAGELIYGVNDLSDRSVYPLITAAGERLSVFSGTGARSVLRAYAGTNFRQISAADCDSFIPEARVATLITELDSRMLAGEIKLKLMSCYPDEHRVLLADTAGGVREIPLVELDRLPAYDHRLCALIPAIMELSGLVRYDFEHLNEIMRILRGTGGCPWDKKQTHASLKPYLIEEAYEAVDAIDRNETDDLYDELGDVLLQVAFHAEIARQHGEFDVSDVTTAICSKMIARHPHIFGEAHASTPEDVRKLWLQVKRKERGISSAAGDMHAITASLPALMRTAKAQKYAVQAGMDFPDIRKSLETVSRNVGTLDSVQDEADQMEALGDLMFLLVNATRLLKLEPELALARATERFIAQYERMEQSLPSEAKNPAET